MTDCPVVAPAFLPTTKPSAVAISSSTTSTASPVSWPGRPTASRMSCSCSQQSNTRICMNRPKVSLPAGVNDSAFHSSSLMASSAASRAPVSSRNLESTSFGGTTRSASTHCSLKAPMSLRTCSLDSRSISMSGPGSPASIASVPTMCDTLSCTLQPGSGDGRRHSSSDNSPSSSPRLAHTSPSAATVRSFGMLDAIPASWQSVAAPSAVGQSTSSSGAGGPTAPMASK